MNTICETCKYYQKVKKRCLEENGSALTAAFYAREEIDKCKAQNLKLGECKKKATF